MNENIKKGLRNWLDIQPSQPYAVQITEIADFELTAIKNRIWYRSDSNELEQMYMQNPEFADKYKFWASRSTPGMEMRKIHTGLPSLIVRTLSNIVIKDLNDLEFTTQEHQDIWEEAEKKNKFRKKLKKTLNEVLCIGDGAYKVSINTNISPYPLLSWYPGDRVDYVYRDEQLEEIVFKTQYLAEHKKYTLHERYGHGYIKYNLYLEEQEVPLNTIDATKQLAPVTFNEPIILGVQVKIFENAKYEGRGGSIFDGKLDSFDAFDEAWSQWMDALRAGRAKTYIPDSLIPRNPETGQALKPNPFDNRYIKSDSDMSEGTKNQIDTEQPIIPHDSYMATYCTALDMCLQGIISPSTLGIDVKKLDNAEAQREKEKTTLYTRDAIVEALQEVIPEVVASVVNAYKILNKQATEDVEVNVPFGEYANPSFESQVETIGKAKTQGIMSIERCVEELYGDTLDEHCKKEEVSRLKAEQGIAEITEPDVRMAAGDFIANVGGANGSQSSKQDLSDE